MPKDQDGRRSRKRKPIVETAEAMLTLDDVARLLNVSRRTIERERVAGNIPAPDLLVGKRMARWKRSTIERWIGGK